jgi:hypothetical protein
MAGFWADMFGTLKSKFQIGGTAGTTLKNSSGNLVVRNAADSADAQTTTSQLNNSGDSIVINSDAAGTGADWKITVSRPTSGMTADVALTLPVDDGTPGQVLSTDGSGVLSWASAGSTASAVKVDTTSLAFGSTSPVTMFTTGASDVITEVEFIIDTAFNGTPTASVGISGNTSKYTSSSALDLTAAAGTSFKFYPNMTAQGAEALIITYSAGGASAGAARVHVYYATPA